ncbi:bifunctional diguanylate cyclase/phosphodiesterase [Sphingomonas sp.]|uniref:putative bifunctional diguanylate cyclase/phosphodiesterase n=1 Tax=Sphingomonas sp. TaxID=28214 RepID=UPI00286CCEA1|nr:bifunctional diguanylate cyclase/phosphodiesterase [Sphingomonas sp.]
MRSDGVVTLVLVAAVLMLIIQGSSFFEQAIADAGAQFGPGVRVTMVMLTLNVALILVGWRRLADLQHEQERRFDAERRAAHIASSDVITGLNNRKGLADLGEALRLRLAARGSGWGVTSIRMHRFKAINERHGYETGDAMLRHIADAILKVLPDEAIAARLNGDEFAVAFPVDLADSAPGNEIAAAMLQAITSPLDVDGRMLQAGAYAGIAVANADTPLPHLLRRADIALEQAASGRSARPIWFDGGMERAMIAHVEIEQGIRVALDNDQFVPFFEPQVDLDSGEIVGFEMLARWNHPSSGLILPEAFIGVAEDIGVIARLSEQVISAALADVAKWDPALSLSVNISPMQLSDPWLAQRIIRLLTEAGVAPERLVVEITESSLFADLELARSIATSLKNQGIRLALDDFGTGYSSLAHLRSLPFDAIKIDRSFTASISHDSESAAIVRAVAALAGAIKVPVIVEGIEDAATHAAVLGLGCQMGQGWYFGKAMPADQAEQLIKRSPSVAAPRTATRKA